MKEGFSDSATQSVALMFPGQGSQYPGMGVDLAGESPRAGEILEHADDVLGYSLSRIMAGEQGQDLDRTIHTQPAVFVHSMALLEVLKERLPIRVAVAGGHSLGEYSALCAAGVLGFDDALEIIRVRATGMDQAQPAGTCAMAAILGMDRQAVMDLVQAHRGDEELACANFNAPDQVVISGTLPAVRRAVEAAGNQRRTKAVMLPVSSAFHTALMEPAVESLASRLESVSFSPPLFPVVANVDAQVYPSSAPDIRKRLLNQVVSPVLWEQCVGTMKGMAASCFFEVGPGKVLTGILRRIDKGVKCVSVCDLGAIRSLEGAEA